MLSIVRIVSLSMLLLAPIPLSATAEDPLVAQAGQLIEEIARSKGELDELRAEMEQAKGDERVLAARRLTRRALYALEELGALTSNVLEQERRGLDASASRGVAKQILGNSSQLIQERVLELNDHIRELREGRESVGGDALITLERRIAEESERLDTILEGALQVVENMESLEMDVEDEKSWLIAVLEDRADRIESRLALALEQVDDLRKRSVQNPGDAELKPALTAAEQKRDAAISNLTRTIAMMRRSGLDATEHRELLIRSTGRLTTDILDAKVARSLIDSGIESLKRGVIENGPRLLIKLLVFVLIVLSFHLLGRLTQRIARRVVLNPKLEISQLLKNMIVTTCGNAVRILGVLIALNQFGVSVGPILAGLGIAGFILGFALQETLGNFAAGMMILTYRPYDVGDLIEAAGAVGVVDAMNLVSTTILTIDHQVLVVPNGKIWGDVIKNVTAQKTRRVDMVFGISYSDDVLHTEQVLNDILRNHPKVLNEPPPVVRLHELGESSVDFVVRPWTRTADYWEVYWDVTREVKLRFDREGISIPFPQRDVHLHQAKSVE